MAIPYENAVIGAYRIDAPFSRAIGLVRTAMQTAGLRIMLELDLAASFRRALSLDPRNCSLLLVAPPRWSAVDAAADHVAAAVIPLHLVVSARGPTTDVYYIKAWPRPGMLEQSRNVRALRRLQLSIGAALGRIGMRDMEA